MVDFDLSLRGATAVFGRGDVAIPHPRVSFYTLGCRLNQAETAMIAER